MKDVKHVSKGKKGKRAKSCVSNCMEKVLFQVIRGEISFFVGGKKRNKEGVGETFPIFVGLFLCSYEMNG